MEEEKICPLLNKPCLKEKCQWWIYTSEAGNDCAISIIAIEMEDIQLMLDSLKRRITTQ